MTTQRYYVQGELFRPSETDVNHNNTLYQLAASYAGALLTFHFQLLHQTAVTSSAITTCLAWLLLLAANQNKRSLILAVYCGTFAGMSMFCCSPDNQSIASISCQTALFSLAAALSYVLIQNLSIHFPKATLTGYGGKLGATAFLSASLCNLLLRDGGDSSKLHQIVTWPETPENAIAYAIIAGGGSIIPYLMLRGRWRVVDDYFLAGLTAFLSLMSSFLFSLFLPELDLAPAAFYTGLFVSMTKSHLCPPARLVIAGAFSGILILNMAPIFAGVGGTLGLTAMLSVLCVNVITHSWSCVVGLLSRAPLFNSDKQLELPLKLETRSREAKIENNRIYRRTPSKSSPSVTPSDGALINVNKEIPKYVDIINDLSENGFKTHSHFSYAGFSCIEHHPSSFMLSFGASVPPSLVNKLIQILEPYGLKAIDLADYEANAIFIASRAKMGFLLNSDTIARLRHLEADATKYAEEIKLSRRLILGTRRIDN